MQIIKQLKEFIIEKNILTTMAAVTMAFSLGTFIRSIVADIILPSIYSLLFSRMSLFTNAFKPVSIINIDNFIKELFQFIFVVIVTFLIVGIIFKNYVNSGLTPTAPTAPTAPAVKNPPSSNNDSAAAIVDVSDGFQNYYY